VSDEDPVSGVTRRQQFLPRNGQYVKEGLQRRFAIAPSALMRARFVVRLHPGIEIPLQLVDGAVDFLAERDAIELVEHGAMEAFADSIGLRVLGAGVIDVLDGEIKFVVVMLGSRDPSAPGTTRFHALRRTAAPGRSEFPPR